MYGKLVLNFTNNTDAEEYLSAVSDILQEQDSYSDFANSVSVERDAIIAEGEVDEPELDEGLLSIISEAIMKEDPYIVISGNVEFTDDTYTLKEFIRTAENKYFVIIDESDTGFNDIRTFAGYEDTLTNGEYENEFYDELDDFKDIYKQEFSLISFEDDGFDEYIK